MDGTLLDAATFRVAAAFVGDIERAFDQGFYFPDPSKGSPTGGVGVVFSHNRQVYILANKSQEKNEGKPDFLGRLHVPKLFLALSRVHQGEVFTPENEKTLGFWEKWVIL